MGADSDSLFHLLTWDKSWKTTTFCSVFLFALLDTVCSEAVIYTDSPTNTYLLGRNVVLACHATEPDSTRWTVKDTTLSMDCRMKPHDRMRLQDNCMKEEKWFNLTIQNLQWDDRGLYTCTNSKETKMTLQVAVPLKEPVEITIEKDRKISNSTSRVDPFVDLRPSSSEDTDVVMLCSSGCAFPPPSLRWYAVTGDSKEKKFIDTSKYHSKVEDCPDGLSRAVSRLTLKADEKSSPQARQNVTCEARHDLTQFSGGDIIKTSFKPVIYGDTKSPPTEKPPIKPVPKPWVDHGTRKLGSDIRRMWLRSGMSVQNARMGGLQAQPLSTLEIAGISAGAAIILLLVLLGAACFMWSRSRDPNQCEDPDAKEKMNTDDQRV